MRKLEEVDGVGSVQANKLRAAFVTTAELLAVQNPVELEKRTKIAEATAKKIIMNAQILCGIHGFKSGLEVEEEMESQTLLTTGIDKLDDKIMGGFEPGALVELYGAYRSGKTQWASYFAVRSQLPENEGGLGGRVLWLDTESSFKPHTIRAMAIRFGMDPELTLGNIKKATIVTSFQFEQLFDQISTMCAEQDYRVVILDSFSGLFRQEYSGLATLRVRQADLNKLLNMMRRLGTATGVVFIYTNQVMAKIALYGGYDNAPIGGHILSHGSDYRFYVRYVGVNDRKIALKDNAGIPPFEMGLKFGFGGFYGGEKSFKKKAPEVIEELRKKGNLRKALKEVEDYKEPEVEVEIEVEAEAT
ncbi:MAG: ATPase domain-containing protein [Candidatus Thorarchaeota archaeon]